MLAHERSHPADLYVGNSTISNNCAEGQGGGVLGAGTVSLVYSTILDNVAPVAANVGAAERLEAFGTVIGPAKTDPLGGQVQPTNRNCQVPGASSSGHNVVTDTSCRLNGPGDVVGAGDPRRGALGENGGLGETRLPEAGSPVLDLVRAGACRFAPLGNVLEGEQHLDGLVADRIALIAGDQRGVARPQGLGCDAGAVELSP